MAVDLKHSTDDTLSLGANGQQAFSIISESKIQPAEPEPEPEEKNPEGNTNRLLASIIEFNEGVNSGQHLQVEPLEIADRDSLSWSADEQRAMQRQKPTMGWWMEDTKDFLGYFISHGGQKGSDAGDEGGNGESNGREA